MKYVKKIKPFFKDERGEMSHLLDEDVRIISSLIITCNKGAVRANHYHKKDIHYSYMLKGKMEYYYRNVNAKSKRMNKVFVTEGDMIKTPPMTIHTMKFLVNSVFLTLSTEQREQDLYEKDTVRVKAI